MIRNQTVPYSMNYEKLQEIISEQDAVELEKYNIKINSKYYLHRSIGPCPFEGNLEEVRVVLLLANPSYAPPQAGSVSHSLEDDHKRKEWQSGWGIFSLHENANPAMRDWWRANLKSLHTDTGLSWKIISNRVAALQINPWASELFDSGCNKLPSINGTMRSIAKEFIKKENLIFVICRREKQWTQILDEAGNKNEKFTLNSLRRAYITPGNLSRSSSAYEKIVDRLKA